MYMYVYTCYVYICVDISCVILYSYNVIYVFINFIYIGNILICFYRVYGFLYII